jgi:hypothetical protein
MQTIFNGPMISHELERARGWSMLERETAESIHDFVARLISFQEAHCALQAKDLCDPFPLLSKPFVEIQNVITVEPMDTRATLTLGVHRIGRKDATFDARKRQEEVARKALPSMATCA